MSYLTKYGTIWGQIPQTTGNVYWVAPGAGAYVIEGRTFSASDNNDGLSPERAFATADKGVNSATGDGDVVVLLPGTHSPSASLALDTDNVTLTGLPGGSGNWMSPRTTIGAVTGDQTINVTADGIEIAFLNIIPVTADSAIDATTVTGLYIHDCSFDMTTPAASTGTIGIDILTALVDGLIERCRFNSDGAQGPGIAGGLISDTLVRDCVFNLSTGTWASAITPGAATSGMVIKDCVFEAGAATYTACIDGTSATVASGVTILGCYFPSSVTVSIDNFGAGEADIAENYEAGVGATDGGALIVAIT